MYFVHKFIPGLLQNRISILIQNFLYMRKMHHRILWLSDVQSTSKLVAQICMEMKFHSQILFQQKIFFWQDCGNIFKGVLYVNESLSKNLFFWGQISFFPVTVTISKSAFTGPDKSGLTLTKKFRNNKRNAMQWGNTFLTSKNKAFSFNSESLQNVTVVNFIILLCGLKRLKSQISKIVNRPNFLANLLVPSRIWTYLKQTCLSIRSNPSKIIKIKPILVITIQF